MCGPCNFLSAFAGDGGEEGFKLDVIDYVVCANPAAQIETNWLNGRDRLVDIPGMKPASEKSGIDSESRIRRLSLQS